MALTQKRRVIYMNDEDWATLSAEAKDRGVTISSILRELMWGPVRTKDNPYGLPSSEERPRRLPDPIRTTLENRPEERKQTLARPFAEFRPVPKSGTKRRPASDIAKEG